MLPQLGFPEFLVIAVVALIVVGPRDLPRLAKTLGGYVRQARGMAREFQKSFEEMGREVELDELRREVEAIKRGEPFDDVKEELRSIEREVKAVDQEARGVKTLPSAKPTTPASRPDASPALSAPAESPAADANEAGEPSTARKEVGGGGG